MKKIVAMIAVMAMVSVSALAQTFGVKAGVNIANIKYSGSGMNISPDSKVGLAVGAFAKFDITEAFVIQPELLYSEKGAKLDISEGGERYKSTMKLNYLSIPVIAKYYVAEGFSLQAGPQFDFLLSAKEDWDATIGGMSESGEDDIKEDVTGLDFGLALGLGYEFTSGLGIDGRYIIGLSELADNPEEGVDTKSKGFQFTLSYSF
ncbi:MULTISPECIES: porin family protein [unclassified Carboxylicivirga]|uniref:porin family protein n=1 Tax=Carboxylicivirga TaxID=1628153 RepID=UPI003D359556